ncbi:hypothetical protein ACIOHE_26445 [Streptomyces sp. NPDC087851]|uniref:hypothetical protein n=1 Tax=Streptomyces sp. NPDC087851 TaxID=3365810 RepID=UPI0038105104
MNKRYALVPNRRTGGWTVWDTVADATEWRTDDRDAAVRMRDALNAQRHAV